MLANQAQCPLYVVHVMSKAAGVVVANARREGQRSRSQLLGLAQYSECCSISATCNSNCYYYAGIICMRIVYCMQQ